METVKGREMMTMAFRSLATQQTLERTIRELRQEISTLTAALAVATKGAN